MLTTTPVCGLAAVPKRPVPFKAEATTHLKCSLQYTPLRNGQASTRPSRRERWGTTASATVRATPANPPEQGEVIDVPEAVEEMKEVIRELGQETNRGIFGVKALKKAALLSVVESLERSNPVPEPTQRMDLLAGDWKLVFSTIVIKGSTRTKLGLREFVSLGDFTQSILPESGTAVNKVDFNVTGLSALSGSLTITAAFFVAGPSRVDIELLEAELAPQQIQRIFEDSFDLLLSVFNPEGWLDITYCDGQMRVGRDNKGNVFVVERR